MSPVGSVLIDDTIGPNLITAMSQTKISNQNAERKATAMSFMRYCVLSCRLSLLASKKGQVETETQRSLCDVARSNVNVLRTCILTNKTHSSINRSFTFIKPALSQPSERLDASTLLVSSQTRVGCVPRLCRLRNFNLSVDLT
jgi:hypothetical protein